MQHFHQLIRIQILQRKHVFYQLFRIPYVSDSCAMLWALGAATFEREVLDSEPHIDRSICKKHGAYIVRVVYQLGDPITTPRRKAEKQAA